MLTPNRPSLVCTKRHRAAPCGAHTVHHLNRLLSVCAAYPSFPEWGRRGGEVVAVVETVTLPAASAAHTVTGLALAAAHAASHHAGALQQCGGQRGAGAHPLRCLTVCQGLWSCTPRGARGARFSFVRIPAMIRQSPWGTPPLASGRSVRAASDRVLLRAMELPSPARGLSAGGRMADADFTALRDPAAMPPGPGFGAAPSR
jgi:hypothetical protein